MKNAIIILVLALSAWAWSGCSKKSSVTVGPPAKQIIGTDATNDSISLNLTWTPGKHYSFRTESVLGADLTLPASYGIQTVVVSLSQDFSLDARAPSKDGVQELDLEIVAQKAYFQPNEKYQYYFDSRESAAEDAAYPMFMFPQLRQLLNVPFKCFIADDGTLLRTEGLDAVTASLKQGNSQLTNFLQSVLNEKNLKMMFGSLNSFLPGTSVKPGDSWPVHLEINPRGINTLIQDGHNTFINWETFDNQQCVHTEYQGNFSTNAADPDNSGAAEIQGGTLSNESWFDPQLEMLVRSSTVGHLTGTISAMGQTVPAQINLTSNFRLLSVEDE